MPLPDDSLIPERHNKLIEDELHYDRAQLTLEHDSLLARFTDEQRGVYDEIINAALQNTGGVYFLYGYGGTGKTFIWRSLSSGLRAKGDIVLTVASSAIAALLIPGGRTTHSRFKIPIEVNEDSLCDIRPGTDLGELLSKTRPIIWDKAPMMNRLCFEALDRSLRDVMRSYDNANLHKPFGGKLVVFGGDFRQILPVVLKGSRANIVSSTLNSSYLWKYCKVLKLTRNMRIAQGNSDSEAIAAKIFSEWILNIGDGNEGHGDDVNANIQIPPDLLISDVDDPIASIVNWTYPSLSNIQNPANFFQERAVLAPTNEMVEAVNDYVLSQLSGEDHVYLSSDSICASEGYNVDQDIVYSTDFLNSIKCSGVPNHKLKLKVGIPVMLMRNIDQSAGLCNGTRLIVTRLGKHIIQADIISGRNIGATVYIPRMVLIPSDTRYPFKFQRKQFPLMVCFAMTINKSQGQSLSQVGLYLRQPVFTHGQLYVALSRVTSRNGLKILICDAEGKPHNATPNVVYKEIFQNVSCTIT